MTQIAPLARIEPPSPEALFDQVKTQYQKGMQAITQRPLLQKSLQTLGTALVAASVGSTICAPLKTLNLGLASRQPLELSRIITSLAPKQLVPHFKAIATNNLTLLMPQLLAQEVVQRSPAFKDATPTQKQLIVTACATAFCTGAFLNQGVIANNRLSRGEVAGLSELAAQRGKVVMLGAAAAFMTREACGLTGLTTTDNPQLVKTVTGIATLADLAFANLSIAGPTQSPPLIRAAAYSVSRSFEASMYFKASKALMSSIGEKINDTLPKSQAPTSA